MATEEVVSPLDHVHLHTRGSRGVSLDHGEIVCCTNLDVLSPNQSNNRATDAGEAGPVCCAAKLIEADPIQCQVRLRAHWAPWSVKQRLRLAIGQ